MSAIKHLFAPRVQASARRRAIDLRGLLKNGNRDIGKAAGAVLVLGFTYMAALGLYWISSDALATMQMTYDARQELLAALQRRSSEAGARGLAKDADGKYRNPFLSAATETLAAAGLDDELRRVAAEEHGIVLSSHAEVNHEDQGPGNKIKIKAVVESRIAAIQALLFRLETNTPMIFVEELDIAPDNEDFRGGAEADPMLHADLTLSAYWQDPAQKETKR